MKRTIIFFGILLLGTCTGLILGYFVGLGIIEGNFIRWETVMLPEAMHPTSFVITDSPTAYLQTEEGELLMNNCSWYSDEVVVWQPVTGIITPTTDLESFERCEQEQPYQNWPTIFIPTSKVREQINCTHLRNVEHIGRCRYIILENDTTRVWRWGSVGLGGIAITIGSAIFFALAGASASGLYVIRKRLI